MVTTEELIKMAEDKSEAENIAIAEWKEKIAKRKLKEKEKIARYQSTKKLGSLIPGKIGESITGILKKQFSAMKTEYKKSLKPIKVKRRPIPPQLRKAMVKRKVLRQPKNIPMPNSVRELQGMRNLRRLLTRQEQIEVDRIFSGSQRSAAMQILRRRLKEQQVNRERSNPRIIYKKDIMTGKTTIDKKIPTERWLM
jgi:hypothetical protein